MSYWIHDLTPYIIKIGSFEVRWYGLMYVVAFGLFYYWFKYLMKIKELPITADQLESLFTQGILGVLVGGRLGYVLFYNFSYYLHNPIDILKTWHGGMSFHGGMLGTIIFIFLWAKRNNISFMLLIGEIGTISPLGLFFGRLGNFINGELWGRATTVPWAIIFPSGGNVPRHPSQLYEAFLEGFLLFGIMLYLHKKKVSSTIKFSVSIIGYAAARIFVEFFRQPDAHLGFLFGDWLTMGQLLSSFMILAGVLLIIYDLRKNPKMVKK